MQLLDVVVLSRRREVSVPILLQGMGELCLLEDLRELRLGFRCRFAPRWPSKLGASLSLLSSLTHLEVCTLKHTPSLLPPKISCLGGEPSCAICGCFLQSHSSDSVLSCRDWLKHTNLL